jgi:hypothetical protein
MMQLASTSVSVHNIRPLLPTRAAGDSEDFESLIVDLSILDTPLDHQSRHRSLLQYHIRLLVDKLCYI